MKSDLPLGWRLSIMLSFEWMRMNGKNLSEMNMGRHRQDCREWVERMIKEIEYEIENTNN